MNADGGFVIATGCGVFGKGGRMMGNLIRFAVWLICLFWTAAALPAWGEGKEDSPGAVSDRTMRRIYYEVKTPYKYGVVMTGENGAAVDSPSVFRYKGRWYMMYITFQGTGYETLLAVSDDLLKWKTLGKVLTRGSGGWDSLQAAGYVALQDTRWGGSYELQRHEGRYWLSYLGGALEGYETDPLAIGMAWTRSPGSAQAWTRLPENPVLHRGQSDIRPFESVTLYKSNVIRDGSKMLGAPFVMFYNGKTLENGNSVERIGMAVSDDLKRWRRCGPGPVIDNGSGVSGDPQVVRIGKVWVMFYFGAFWRPKAFDTFACSHDLMHWTKWTGPDLVAPSESWDAEYAHKPWVVKHKGVVYHFYCAVGDRGRVIALATSKDLRK